MSEPAVAVPASAKRTTRHAWLAVILSLLAIGLGQVYCGKLVRGLLFACLAILSIPTIAAILANQVPVGGFTLALVGLGGLVSLVVIAVVDAYRLARRTKSDYALKEYNRVTVYVLLYLIFKGGGLGAFLFTRDYLLEAFIVPSPSMCPTIWVGDRVLGNKRAYDKADPRRGDIIIFHDPEKWRQNRVKRIVAIGGDTVEIRAGQVILNGKPIEREVLPGVYPGDLAVKGQVFREINGDVSYEVVQPNSTATQPSSPTFIVPQHHCFVLGDNRGESRDSRQVGPVPFASIVARADYLYWPRESWLRFGRLGL